MNNCTPVGYKHWDRLVWACRAAVRIKRSSCSSFQLVFPTFPIRSGHRIRGNIFIQLYIFLRKLFQNLLSCIGCIGNLSLLRDLDWPSVIREDLRLATLGYASMESEGIWEHIHRRRGDLLCFHSFIPQKHEKQLGNKEPKQIPLAVAHFGCELFRSTWIHLRSTFLHAAGKCQLVNPSRCKQMNKAVWKVITCWQKFSYEPVQYQPRPSSKTLLALAVIRDNFHFVGHFCFEHFPESGLFSLGYPSSTENITNWFWCDKSSSEKLCKRDDTICKKATIQNCSIPNRQWRRKGTSRTVFLQTTVFWQMSRNPRHKQKHWY